MRGAELFGPREHSGGYREKGKTMGRVFEWTGRNRCGDNDARNGRAPQRRRDGGYFTCWDWVKWWRAHDCGDSVYRSTGVGPPGSGRHGGDVAVCVVQVVLWSSVPSIARARSGDCEGL